MDTYVILFLTVYASAEDAKRRRKSKARKG
jgi:hypothetical protein